jgi:lactosylceramide 4-alpha-galactosyltransferase
MLEKKTCQGFHVLPIEMCYAITGMQFPKLMEDESANTSMAAVENSLVVHFWNHVSRSWKLQKNQTAAYVQLAHQFCPKVMALEGNYF